jgi:hypothetical protein
LGLVWTLAITRETKPQPSYAASLAVSREKGVAASVDIVYSHTESVQVTDVCGAGHLDNAVFFLHVAGLPFFGKNCARRRLVGPKSGVGGVFRSEPAVGASFLRKMGYEKRPNP